MRRTCGSEEKYHCLCNVQTSRLNLTALCARPVRPLKWQEIELRQGLEGFNFPGSRAQAEHLASISSSVVQCTPFLVFLETSLNIPTYFANHEEMLATILPSSHGRHQDVGPKCDSKCKCDHCRHQESLLRLKICICISLMHISMSTMLDSESRYSIILLALSLGPVDQIATGCSADAVVL
jgi:hypothetical protein